MLSKINPAIGIAITITISAGSWFLWSMLWPFVGWLIWGDDWEGWQVVIFLILYFLPIIPAIGLAWWIAGKTNNMRSRFTATLITCAILAAISIWIIIENNRF